MIGDLDRNAPRQALGRDLDRSPHGCVLDGVFEQVREDLFEQNRIDVDEGQITREHRTQRRQIGRRGDQRVHLGACPVPLSAPILERVVEHAPQPLRRASARATSPGVLGPRRQLGHHGDGRLHQHRLQRGAVQIDQHRLPADQALGVLGQVEVALDAGTEGAEAERLQGHPHLEGPEAAGQLQAPVGEVHLTRALDRVAVEVVRVDGERPFQPGPVADQHAAALHRLVQPLVRIERHRVGALDPGQRRPPRGGECGEAPVGRVDVQPEPFGGTDVGQAGQRVDGAGVGRAGAGAQGERDAARVAVGPDGRGHRVRRQAPAVVGRQHPHLVRPQPHGAPPSAGGGARAVRASDE